MPKEELPPIMQKMAAGHLARKGHVLTGYLESIPGSPELKRVVRTCCDPLPG